MVARGKCDWPTGVGSCALRLPSALAPACVSMTSVLTSEKCSLSSRRSALETATAERAAEKYIAAASLIGEVHTLVMMSCSFYKGGATGRHTNDRVPCLVNKERAKHVQLGDTAWVRISRYDTGL